MSGVTLTFNQQLTATDPHNTPVLIVGQLRHLQKLQFSDVHMKLEPRVKEDFFTSVLKNLNSCDTGTLYLNTASLHCLPKQCSRHNAPARPHAIAKLVKSHSAGRNLSIVIVCEKTEVLASAAAVARCYPLYSRKTSNSTSSYKTSVEFIIVNNTSDTKSELSASDINCITEVAGGIRRAAKIVDTPCSEMNTSIFLQEIINAGIELGITPQVFKGSELKDHSFNGIYSVGMAAENPPALVILHYVGENAKNTIALVGKGIVYDTGGLSIKAKTSMPGMKRDCGGAAAVLEAFKVAVKLGFRENLCAVFCLAENAVGPKAIRPDDIITMYSGRTVEVNNTDAEGRLVLADGVAYSQKDLLANIIVDIATLTGAQGTATGKYHGAVVTNQENWESSVVSAGQMSGDLVHPLPYCPELHFSEFRSTVADMKNSVADRSNAQSSCAGLFIASHIGFEFPGTWVHIDMAAPVECNERATGYGVALLLTLFGHASENPLLQSLAPLNTKSILNGPESENASKKMKLV